VNFIIDVLVFVLYEVHKFFANIPQYKHKFNNLLNLSFFSRVPEPSCAYMGHMLYA
jgi:hypothetical protein